MLFKFSKIEDRANKTMSGESGTGIKAEFDMEEFYFVTQGIKSEETNTINNDAVSSLQEYEDHEPKRISETTSQPAINTSMRSRCRLCAAQEDDLVDMFGPNKQDPNVLEKIQHCLPIVVNETDPLPKQACRLCLANVELCYRFHKTVTEAEKQLFALDGQTFGELAETEESFQPTAHDNTEGSLEAMSNSEMRNSKSTTISEAVRMTNRTMKEDIDSANSKPSLKIVSITGNADIKNIVAESRRGSSIHTEEHQNAELEIDEQKTFESVTEKKCSTQDRKEVENVERDRRDFHRHRRTCKADQLVFDKQTRPKNTHYRCDPCKKVFKSQSNLHVHNRIHTGIGLFSCKYCGRKFTTKSSRNRHHLLHTGERPFKCDMCGSKFVDKGKLKSHIDHFHMEGKSFQCDYCKRKLSSTYYLPIHLSICKERFRTKC